MAEKKSEAPVVDRQKFIARKLKVINELPNKAKAKKLAERLLSSR